LHSIEKTGKYTTSINATDANEIEGFVSENDIILFRIIQEIINNIINHASANHIHLSIEKKEQFIIIKIADNGIGFDTTIIKQENQGIGLHNIYTRAKMINMDVEINSSIGEGTVVILKMNI
jgi:signal transduction histidine kinase